MTQVDNAESVLPQVTLNSYYDFEGNRTWLGDNLGGGISYAWNNQRLQSMAITTGDYKSAQVGFGYDNTGRLTSLKRTSNWDYSTPINTNFTLDLLDRVTSITHSKVSGEDASTLSQFSYTYDANGNRSSSTTAAGNLLLNDGLYGYTYYPE